MIFKRIREDKKNLDLISGHFYPPFLIKIKKMRFLFIFFILISNSFAHQLIFETKGFSLIKAKTFKRNQPVTIENKKHSDIWVRLLDEENKVLNVFKILMNSSQQVVLKQKKNKTILLK